MAASVEKQGLTHDEAISYLAATCHQGEWAEITFEERPPFGMRVRAAEWKRLIRPEDRLCFGRIASDLGRQDIHPPLYFWLLHLVGITFGLELWTGLALNIVLSLLTAAALFGLARHVLRRDDAAALVAGTWFLSPASGLVFSEARQYELLALIVVAFVWQTVRFADDPARAPLRSTLLLGLLCAAGALTHFYFALVAAACALALIVRLGRAQRAALLRGLVSIAAGYALFALLDPAFYLSFARARAQSIDFSLGSLVDRAGAVAASFADFLLPPTVAAGWLGVAVFGLLVALAAWLIVGRRRAPGAWMVLMFGFLAGANAVLYLAFISPSSAMDPRHLSAVWPFCAFVPVVAICAPGRLRPVLAASLSAVMLVSGAVALLRSPGQAPAPELAATDSAVVDSVARGVLLPVVWQLDDDARVLAADQRWLLAHDTAWLPVPGRRPVLVSDLPVSDPRYGNSAAGSRRIIALADRRQDLGPAGAGAFGIGRVFSVRGR